MSNNILYPQVGDYLIPNLILPPEETNITLGKWRMLYKTYLGKHNKPLFNSLLIQGKLYQHCAEAENQLKCVCRIQNIEARAREIVCNELIYK